MASVLFRQDSSSVSHLVQLRGAIDIIARKEKENQTTCYRKKRKETCSGFCYWCCSRRIRVRVREEKKRNLLWILLLVLFSAKLWWLQMESNESAPKFSFCAKSLCPAFLSPSLFPLSTLKL